MKNKLVSDEIREQFKQMNGYDYPERRCCGKSTGEALEAIGIAMQNSGEWYPINVNDKHIKHLLVKYLSILGFKFFEFKANQFRYNVFGE